MYIMHNMEIWKYGKDLSADLMVATSVSESPYVPCLVDLVGHVPLVSSIPISYSLSAPSLGDKASNVLRLHY